MVSEGIFMDAVTTGAFIEGIESTGREIEMGLREATISAATGGSADVHVQMNHLVEFYNALSELHDEIYVFSRKLARQADELGDMKAGGKVAGIVTAWNEMTAGAGARNADASLAANLQAVDNKVLSYMNSLNKSAMAYAEREDIAIVGLDKAAGTTKAHKHSENHGNKHGSKPGKGQQVTGGAVLQGGSGQVLQGGSEQVLQAPANDTSAHGGLVLGG